jgi:hypothetical protein
VLYKASGIKNLGETVQALLQNPLEFSAIVTMLGMAEKIIQPDAQVTVTVEAEPADTTPVKTDLP